TPDAVALFVKESDVVVGTGGVRMENALFFATPLPATVMKSTLKLHGAAGPGLATRPTATSTQACPKPLRTTKVLQSDSVSIRPSATPPPLGRGGETEMDGISTTKLAMRIEKRLWRDRRERLVRTLLMGSAPLEREGVDPDFGCVSLR